MNIKTKILDYLKLKKLNVGRSSICVCPKCNKRSGQIRPSVDFSVYCAICGEIGNIFDVVRILEKDKKDLSNDEIEIYLKQLFNLDYLTEKEIDDILSLYKELDFDLVRIAKNTKIPIQREWTTKENKDVDEWKKWLLENSNIGVKTGKASEITVIDVDFLNNSQKDELRIGNISKERTEELLNIRKERLNKFEKEIGYLFKDTLTQESLGGFHYFYKYNDKLKKTTVPLDYCNLDIENNGGYILLHPSVVQGDGRNLIKKPVVEMSEKLLSFLKKRKAKKSVLDKAPVESFNSDFKADLVKEGYRSNVIMHMGGILRTKLNRVDTNFAVSVINKRLFSPPLSDSELRAKLASLEKYSDSDEQETASKILSYVKMVGESTARDVRDALKLEKETVDRLLSRLVKEEFLMKKKRMYKALKKVEWREEFYDESQIIDYKMPYFHDSSIFRWGDMLVLGGGPKIGKCISNGYLFASGLHHGYYSGLKDISDIGKDRESGWSKCDIRVFDGKKKHKLCKKPNYFYKEKVNKTIKIKTHFGYELEGTPEHPIKICQRTFLKRKNPFTMKGNLFDTYCKSKIIFKKLEEIKIGDEAVIVSPEKFSKTYPTLPSTNRTSRKNKNKNKSFNIPTRINKEVAQLFGYYLGDGSLGKNSISIYQNTKYKNIRNELEYLGEYFKVNLKICEKKENSIHFKFNSWKLTQLIRKIMKITKNYKNLKSPKRFIPQIILFSPKDIQKYFISSLFNCESYLSKNNLLSFSSASKKIADVLHIMLLNFDIIAKKSKKWNKKYKRFYYHISMGREMTIKFLEIFDPCKYKNRKIKNFEKKTYNLKRMKNQYKTFHYLDKIISKEEINEEKNVYDFNIKGHQFWSNGFVSHNSHISLNMLKRLVDQGKKPYYINLEAGNRFADISKAVGLKEGDFYYTTCFDPEEIELEDNAITILDWLLPKEYAETDKLYQYFAYQLLKHGGNLIILAQLKKDGSFFAENMLSFFPAFVCRYFYNDENDGSKGYFQIDHRREPIKEAKNKRIIPCTYLWDEKQLVRDDELKKGGL